MLSKEIEGRRYIQIKSQLDVSKLEAAVLACQDLISHPMEESPAISYRSVAHESHPSAMHHQDSYQ